MKGKLFSWFSKSSQSELSRSISTLTPEATNTTNLITEPRDRYVVDGYHPVGLGDVFNKRYVVLGKLGFGKYSTVWLAQDLS
jgi:serine/threonine-protein kinase SRPK3